MIGLIFILFSISIVGQETNNNKISLPEGMVFVPAGNFIMGSVYGDPDERPKHIAFTNAFYIDKYEITNAEFSKLRSSQITVKSFQREFASLGLPCESMHVFFTTNKAAVS